MTRLRVGVQAFFLLLFLAAVWLTSFGRIKGWPTSLFLEMDPLVGATTLLTTHTVYRAVLWSLGIVFLTLLVGRAFCNWICPMGTLLQLSGWLSRRGLPDKQRIEGSRYRRYFGTKFFILAFILAAALFGTAQNGLLDPQPTLYRSITIGVLPLLGKLGLPIYVRPHDHQFAWLILGFFVFILAMNAVVPRFFCRTLCPLGGFLGFLSRFSLARIERDPAKCVDCDLCLKSCEGASDPQGVLRKSECFVCFNCIEDCPYDALSFQWLPKVEHEVTAPDVGRRATIFAGILGALFYGISRSTGETTSNFKPTVIRPPGSVPEHDFLARCIKCDQCIRVCPSNVLQPAAFEAGIEGFFTPVMNMRMGACELNCTLCGTVCPTGAIQKMTLEQKHGEGKFAAQGPVKSGTAFYDRGRCFPWAMDRPCVVCQEVCPVSPKAIYTRDVVIQDRWGQPVTLHRPYVDPSLCIGCGTCEHECPVADMRAIRITAVGETRSKERSLLLESGNTGAKKVPVGGGSPVGPAPTEGGDLSRTDAPG
ncbi:MAG: 4Fe-4S dicluster domain-containing protein [Armatimonadetes bacterium]|nr:4Fe-4S dicluster domain-containing protein [Armatimonadota bacterium]